MGHNRTLERLYMMSALPAKADIGQLICRKIVVLWFSGVPLTQPAKSGKTYRPLQVSVALPELGRLMSQIHFHTSGRPKSC